MPEYIIAVGSNIDPVNNVEQAFDLVRQRLDQNTIMAPLLQTKSRGNPDQPDYLNTAFYCHSALSPVALKQQLQAIEVDLKRVRTENKNLARTIDLDICVCNGRILDDDYHHYDFVKQSVDFFNTDLIIG